MKIHHLDIVDNLFKEQELINLLEIVNELNFQDGKSTASERAVEVKHNLQAASFGGHAQQLIAQALINALSQNETVKNKILPLKVYPPIISKYLPGMQYGVHVDSPVMASADAGLVRTDIAMTLFLSDPTTYEGGELVLIIDNEEKAIKLNKGSAVFYPASMLHRVNMVKSGQRLAMVTWIQSLIPDAHKRNIIADIKRIEEKISSVNPHSSEALGLLQVYSNLIKMWSIL